MSRRVALSHYTDESGLLSIDFIAGFTIFMVAFIFVVTMASGLLVGLSSKSIDYDAVAYRTGVILAEDPGWEATDKNKPTTNWEQVDQYHTDKIVRLGLALDKLTPNILSNAKVTRFFSQPGTYLSYDNGDYNTKLVFGDYPYKFNISLWDVANSRSYNNISPIGDPVPNDYGYIKRVVKIRQPGYANIDGTNVATPWIGQSNFTINIDMDEIYHTTLTSPEYQPDPLQEGINISIFNLNSTTPALGGKINITNIQLVKDGTIIPPDLKFSVNNDATQISSFADIGNNTVHIALDPAYLRAIEADEYTKLQIIINFNDNSIFLSPPYDYLNAQQHKTFIPAVLEVKVW